MSGGADSLSPREAQVLDLLVLGLTNREVAERLHISVRTAESHRASIQRKLGLSARSELVRFALAHRGIFGQAVGDDGAVVPHTTPGGSR
jgi:two-component system, NarL family, response regulator NreC